ncbi:hypothetical protein AALB16_13540 [Lachnospiraceae bacterium 62-35]
MNSRFPNQHDTSEILKAKQYGAAALLHILIIIIMTMAGWIWGNVTLGSGRDEISLKFIIFCVRNMVLIFGIADLVSALCHLFCWNRNGRPSLEDDNNNLLSDWKGGERSPLKVSLALLACILVLGLLIVGRGFF